MTEKLTLEQMTAKLDIAAHNSNLENLAHGLRYLAENEREAEKAYENFKAEVAKIREEINELAQGEVGEVDYNAMRSAYDRSRGVGLTFSK